MTNYIACLPDHPAFFCCETFIMDWYQRCLRRNFWRWGVCGSFSMEIFPSADFLLSSESLPAWKTVASLPLRGRECCNLRTTFGPHKTETSEPFSIKSSDQQDPSKCFTSQSSGRLGFPNSEMISERNPQAPWLWHAPKSAENVLPPCGSDA